MSASQDLPKNYQQLTGILKIIKTNSSKLLRILSMFRTSQLENSIPVA